MENKKEIRILPMSKKLEFPDKTWRDVQKEFFLGELINLKNGHYNYRKVGMNCVGDSIILFQFDGAIIASAKFISIAPPDNETDAIEYKGSYIFDKDSIEVFEPITVQEIFFVSPTIKNFSQVKQRIDYEKLPEIQNLIEKKKIALIHSQV